MTTLAAAPTASRARLVDGVRTVAQQEFRLRIRAGRWRWLLAAWFAVLVIFTALVRMALGNVDANLGGDQAAQRGTPMFGTLMLFVLGLALLVVPALTAQSVNGDRERGTLATLQVTLLSPAEIAIGKLAAAWGTAVVFLALSLPLVGWSVLEGGVPLTRVLVTLGVVTLLLGVVCAIAQALSALLARSTTSSVLSYVAVFALTIGTLIVFGLATAATAEQVTRHERVPVFDGPEPQPGGAPQRFEEQTYTETVTHTERTWWLLAPNPFVVLADAAPQLPPRREPGTGILVPASELDPLGEIGLSVRALRLPPDDEPEQGVFTGQAPPERRGPAVWPWGLAADVALGALALGVTIRRLRTPSRRLPRGVRVA